jgi:flagellar motor switch protein FliN
MSAVSLSREICGALVDEVALVVGAMIDATPTLSAGDPATGRQWRADIRLEGPVEGVITFGLDYDGAVAITRLMTGIEGELASEALLDTLREVLAQAVAALSHKPVARGAKFTVSRLEEQDGATPDGESITQSMAADTLTTPLSLTAWGALAVAQAATAPAAVPPDDRIEVLLDIDLPLTVRFGRTELPLRHLTRLAPGSVIDLGRSPDDPVEVLVGNRVVARGEVVVVAGSYGIRILDVVSQRERVRSMEA